MTRAEQRILLSLTITCAVLGAAAATWFGSASPGWRLVVVAGAALLGSPVAWWSTAGPIRPNGGPSSGKSREHSSAPPAHPEPRPDRTGEPATWWSQTTGAGEPAPVQPPNAAPQARLPTPPEPPAETLIAQCPSCGGFRLDVSRAGPALAFRCAGGCGHAWSWSVGTPWPAMTVRRAFGGQLDRGRDRVALATENRE